jgi:hypothetical protein
MGLALRDLTLDTRLYMIEEISLDIANGALYVSPRLSARGKDDYPGLLTEAAENHDDAWLAIQLGAHARLNAREEQPKQHGHAVTTAMPADAAQIIAEDEFNRFYMRGLCAWVIENGLGHVEIYRARPVANPTPRARAKIGSRVSPASLLAELRAHPGVESALGVERATHCGLSIKMPRS